MKKLFTLRHWLNAAMHGRQLVQAGLLFISTCFACFTMEAQTQTGTTITSSSNASVFGGPVTFTSTTKSNPFFSAPVPVPEGTVSFMDGAVVLAANVAISATGTATFTTAALAVGSHAIAAVYNGTKWHVWFIVVMNTLCKSGNHSLPRNVPFLFAFETEKGVAVAACS